MRRRRPHDSCLKDSVYSRPLRSFAYCYPAELNGLEVAGDVGMRTRSFWPKESLFIAGPDLRTRG
jgi:hypothetical protein